MSILSELIIMFAISAFIVIGLEKVLALYLKKEKFKLPSLFKRKTYYARQGYPTITFDHFLELYQINPDKWDWKHSDGDWIIKYNIISYHKVSYPNNYGYYRAIDSTSTLYFETKKDQKRFSKWLAKKDYEETLKRSSNTYATVLEDVQKDIEEKMEKINAEHKAEMERIEAERKANEEKYAEFMRQAGRISQLAGTGSISTSNGPSFSEAMNKSTISAQEACDMLNQVISSVKQHQEEETEYIPLPINEKVKGMYLGQPCRIYIRIKDGQLFLKLEDGSMINLADTDIDKSMLEQCFYNKYYDYNTGKCSAYTVLETE